MKDTTGTVRGNNVGEQLSIFYTRKRATGFVLSNFLK